MIYCPKRKDEQCPYVDQEIECLGCEYYIEFEDTCAHPDTEEESEE